MVRRSRKGYFRFCVTGFVCGLLQCSICSVGSGIRVVRVIKFVFVMDPEMSYSEPAQVFPCEPTLESVFSGFRSTASIVL